MPRFESKRSRRPTSRLHEALGLSLEISNRLSLEVVLGGLMRRTSLELGCWDLERFSISPRKPLTFNALQKSGMRARSISGQPKVVRHGAGGKFRGRKLPRHVGTSFFLPKNDRARAPCTFPRGKLIRHACRPISSQPKNVRRSARRKIRGEKFVRHLSP